jgi:hypothetical protein
MLGEIVTPNPFMQAQWHGQGEFGGCMYLDSQKHVTFRGVGAYSRDSDVLEFVESFPGADYSVLKQFAKAKIDYLRRVSRFSQTFVGNRRIRWHEDPDH